MYGCLPALLVELEGVECAHAHQRGSTSNTANYEDLDVESIMNRGYMGYSTVSLPASSTSSGHRRAPKQEPGIGDVLGGAFVSVPLVLLYLLGSTFIWQQLITYPEDTSNHKKGDMLDFADSWYFTVVTFTTVGYGDYLPVSQGAKRFFMFWCILSSLINFTVVSKFLSSVLVYKPSPEDNVDCENCGRPQLQHASKFFHVWPRLASVLRWLVVLLLLLILGSYLIRDTYWTQKGRRLDWVDCWYWSFATLTTVGYGDLYPQHQKVLFSFFFLVCVTVFCTVLAEVAGIVVDLDRFGRMERMLSKGFSKELMDVIDTNGDGRVSKLEFMMYVLDHLSIADMSEMTAISKVFDALDHNGEGMLYMHHARGHLQKAMVTRYLHAPYSYMADPRHAASCPPQHPTQHAPPPQTVAYAPPRKTALAKTHYAPQRSVPSHQAPLLPEASAPPAPGGPVGRGMGPGGPAARGPAQQAPMPSRMAYQAPPRPDTYRQ